MDILPPVPKNPPVQSSSTRRKNRRDANLDSHTCFYCGVLVSENNKECDHFPIPAMLGGQTTVISCRSCHDMKDRFRFADWPTEWLSCVLTDMPKLSRETKIWLSKWLSHVLEIHTQEGAPVGTQGTCVGGGVSKRVKALLPQIDRMHADGESMTAIARMLGLSHATVSRALKCRR